MLLFVFFFMMQSSWGSNSVASKENDTLQVVHITETLLQDVSQYAFIDKSKRYVKKKLFSEGDQKAFYVRYLSAPDTKFLMDFTLKKQSDIARIWFANSDIDVLNGVMNEASIDIVVAEIDTALRIKTPYHPIVSSANIIETVRTIFGDFPDLDQDGVVDILLFNIVEPKGTNGFVAGYFDPLDLTEDPRSNQADVIYVDIHPLIYNSPTDMSYSTERAQATIAHELQHLILQGYKKNLREETFINEGLSELSEILCGYSPRGATHFFDYPNRPLFSWSTTNTLPDYARASLWFHYIHEQNGSAWLKNFISKPKVGITNYSQELRNIGVLIEQTWKTWYAGFCMQNKGYGNRLYTHPQRRDLTGISPIEPEIGLSRSITEQRYLASFYKVLSPRKAWLSSTQGSTMVFAESSPEKRLHANQVYHFNENETVEWVQFWDNPDDTSTIQTTIYYEPSLSEEVVSVGNGELSPPYLFASFLDLKDKTKKAGIPFPIKGLNEISGIGFQGLFESEFQDSQLPANSPKRYHLVVYKLENGQIQDTLMAFMNRESRRNPGAIRFDWIRFDKPIPAKDLKCDTLFIEISSAISNNFLSIGFQGNATVPAYVTSEQWKPVLKENTPFTDLLVYGNTLPVPKTHIPLISLLHNRKASNHQIHIIAERNGSEIQFKILDGVVPSQNFLSMVLMDPDGNLSSLEFEEFFSTKIKPYTLEKEGHYRLYIKFWVGYNIYSNEFDWYFPKEKSFALQKTYPNPFNPLTHLEINCLSRVHNGKIQIYDVLGKLVRTEILGAMETGIQTFPLDFSRYASGVYFVKVLLTDESMRSELLTTKITLIK